MRCASLWSTSKPRGSQQVRLECFRNYEHFLESFEQYGLHLPEVLMVTWEPIQPLLSQVIFSDERDENLVLISMLGKYIKMGKVIPPVLVDEKGELFDGRHRIVAAARSGLKWVPVVVIHTEGKWKARRKTATLPRLRRGHETVFDRIMKRRG